MARKTSIIDDIDGTDDARAVSFAVDGRSYTIDLSPKNLDKLHAALKPFTDAGTRIGGQGRSASTGKRSDLSDVRQWANKNGYSVSPRGRVPGEVLTAYDAAH